MNQILRYFANISLLYTLLYIVCIFVFLTHLKVLHSIFDQYSCDKKEFNRNIFSRSCRLPTQDEKVYWSGEYGG